MKSKITKSRAAILVSQNMPLEIDFIDFPEKLDFGHCSIDGPGFIKLYNSIGDKMNWPLILMNGRLRYGNKRLTYAKMLGYTHIEVVNVNDDKELERVRVMTCWKRL